MIIFANMLNIVKIDIPARDQHVSIVVTTRMPCQHFHNVAKSNAVSEHTKVNTHAFNEY